MTAGTTSLDTLRKEIDRIDDQIHRLLMQRTEIVGEVAKAKDRESGGAPRLAFRPGREAEVLRSLLERHDNGFPAASLIRIWREIMSGMTKLQTDFIVAVHCPDETEEDRWDIARDHFGLGADFNASSRIQEVLGAVRDGQATVAVLGTPTPEDEAPWWPSIALRTADAPRIVARLPFLRDENTLGDAVAIARAAPEATGNDRSLIVVETEPETSRRAVLSALDGQALGAIDYVAEHARDSGTLYLLEVAGFVDSDDARLDDIASAGDTISGIIPIGCYAVPVELGGKA